MILKQYNLLILRVTCSVCRKHGCLKHHKAHHDSKCACTHFKPAALSPSDLLSRPEELSLSPFEETENCPHQAQHAQLQHSGGEDRGTGENKNNNDIIIIIYFLQPLKLMQVSSPSVSSGTASQTTLRRRSSELQDIRKRVSGGEQRGQDCREGRSG